MRIRIAAFFVALLAHLPAFAEPATVTLFFELSYNGIKIADVTETFTPLGNGDYVLKSHATATGLAKILHGDVIRESRGQWNVDSGLQMSVYQEKRGGRPLQKALFDAQTGQLSLFRGNKETRVEEPSPPVYDYLTAVYRAYVEKRPTAGKMTITNGWRLKDYDYQIGKTEEMTTALGTVSVVPVSRESPRGKRIFWLAPKIGYLPVRTYVDDKGHTFEAVLLSASIADKH